MIEFQTGDIFQAKVDALVNPVNCVGVMGKGLAFLFKKRFPENFNYYATACTENKVKIGEMCVFETNETYPKFIINFPTKEHWRNPSSIVYLVKGLKTLNKVILEHNIKSVAIPKIGCGLGGLLWKDVKPLMIDSLKVVSNDVQIIVFE